MKLRQPSLTETLGIVKDRAAPDLSGLPEVYDWFGGAGGFSEGARQAGCRVAWVCDSDPQALQTHAANHPATEHCLTELPMPRSRWPFPTDGRPFHSHFSPPCQKFSEVNKKYRLEGDRAVAKNLVTWSLETALASGAASWSLEQVPNQEVVRLVEEVKQRYPGRIAYAKIDFEQLGVPQTRKRLIVGPPDLVAWLLRCRERTKRRSVRAVIAIPRGTHVRNSKKWTASQKTSAGHIQYTTAGWGDNCHSIDEPSPTVCAGRGLNWVTCADGSVHAAHPRLRAHEYAALQTFPERYRWPEGEQLALKQIGNAVPPLVAKLIMSGVPSGSARPVSPSLVDDDDYNADMQDAIMQSQREARAARVRRGWWEESLR